MKNLIIILAMLFFATTGQAQSKADTIQNSTERLEYFINSVIEVAYLMGLNNSVKGVKYSNGSLKAIVKEILKDYKIYPNENIIINIPTNQLHCWESANRFNQTYRKKRLSNGQARCKASCSYHY